MNWRSSLLLVLVVAGALSRPAAAGQGNDAGDKEGHFVGTPAWRGNRRSEFTLTEPLMYIDPQGTRWIAPTGAKHDCASIPRVLWSLVGGPCEGDYLRASIVHDVYCELGRTRSPKREPWQRVHRMFYHAMRAGGVPKPKALLLYGAVYKFGPTWDLPSGFWRRLWLRIWRFGGPPLAPPPPYQVTESDVETIRQLVESGNPETPEAVEELVGR